MCSFATKFVVESWSTCAELLNKVLPNSVSAVVTLVEKLALGATKEPLIKHCEAIERSQFQQAQFIANCLKEIARCKAKIACLENPVRQPTFKNWLRKMLDL